MGYAAIPLDATGVPIPAGYKPDSANFYAIQSSQRTKTDTASNTYSPPVFEVRTQEDIRTGLTYIVTTGKLATATNPNLVMGASFFNPLASGKTMLVVSARSLQGLGNNDIQLYLTTSDPAFATALTPTCLLPGSGFTSAASVTCAANNAAASVAVAGTRLDFSMMGAAGDKEFLPTGYGIPLPAGFGLAIFTTIATAGTAYGMTFKHTEY